MTSRRIVRVRTQTLYGKKRVPSFGDLSEFQSVECDFGTAQSLIVLEALLTLPQHHEQRSSQYIARGVPKRLVVFRITIMPNHPGFTFLQPAVVFSKIRFYVSIYTRKHNERLLQVNTIQLLDILFHIIQYCKKSYNI